MALPLLNGSVVKIWHGTRGHDYVVVCIDRNAKKIGLLKHTTINYDGSIHGAVTGVRKWIPYEESEGFSFVSCKLFNQDFEYCDQIEWFEIIKQKCPNF